MPPSSAVLQQFYFGPSYMGYGSGPFAWCVYSRFDSKGIMPAASNTDAGLVARFYVGPGGAEATQKARAELLAKELNDKATSVPPVGEKGPTVAPFDTGSYKISIGNKTWIIDATTGLITSDDAQRLSGEQCKARVNRESANLMSAAEAHSLTENEFIVKLNKNITESIKGGYLGTTTALPVKFAPLIRKALTDGKYSFTEKSIVSGTYIKFFIQWSPKALSQRPGTCECTPPGAE